MQSTPPRQPYRRFKDHRPPGKPMVLEADHPAMLERRTLFPNRTTAPQNAMGGRLMKSGKHSRKLGSHVVKGRWAGMPIFSLTLEERKTCPPCENAHNCYGNKMQWSERYEHGPAFEAMLERELAEKQAKHPKGFVVRLHVLGDFYSEEYVIRWGEWLNRFPALQVFGYTAHNPFESDIGLALLCLRRVHPTRWWVRWSNRGGQTWLSTGPGGIVCPAQTGQTACCGTCALCWTAEKVITFLEH